MVPNEGLHPVRLGMTLEQIERALNEPPISDTSRIPDEERFRFIDAQVRVSMREGQLVEVSIWPPAQIMKGERSLFEDATLWRELVREDGDAHECAGFIVLKRLGLALSGFHDGAKEQLAVTAFELGRWDSLKGAMRPYSV